MEALIKSNLPFVLKNRNEIQLKARSAEYYFSLVLL